MGWLSRKFVIGTGYSIRYRGMEFTTASSWPSPPTPASSSARASTERRSTTGLRSGSHWSGSARRPFGRPLRSGDPSGPRPDQLPRRDGPGARRTEPQLGAVAPVGRPGLSPKPRWRSTPASPHPPEKSTTTTGASGPAGSPSPTSESSIRSTTNCAPAESTGPRARPSPSFDAVPEDVRETPRERMSTDDIWAAGEATGQSRSGSNRTSGTSATGDPIRGAVRRLPVVGPGRRRKSRVNLRGIRRARPRGPSRHRRGRPGGIGRVTADEVGVRAVWTPERCRTVN